MAKINKSDELIIANKELAFQNEEKEKREAELIIANKELVFQNEEKEKLAAELIIARTELAFQKEEKGKRAAELVIANKELVFQDEEKGKRAAELGIANKELAFQDEEKGKRAAELGIANIELAFQDEEKGKRAAELGIANIELAFQDKEKGKRAAELGIANIELAFQDEEKEKRAAELSIANIELAFQNNEKEKRAAELSIANIELAYQNEEKEKRAEELTIANKELAFQNKVKEKRAEELVIANKELAFQNDEKEKRAAELSIANKELAFQNKEKEKRAAELSIANIELAFQNDEKEKRAAELIIANKELTFQNIVKEKRAEELVIANKELAFQNDEKGKRAAELSIANKELAFQNKEKEKRAAELVIANKELAFQNDEKEKRAAEKEKRAAELIIANKELAFQNEEKEKRALELVILSGDLKAQQEELRRANDELHEKAQLLEKQKEEVEQINKEVEEARRSLEDKAVQLTLTSKYKSEFLANMSHELRTPLNSLLILAQQLFENNDGNLSEKQINYAKTIHSCGNDLIRLINDILDLSKIESGVISVDIIPVDFREIISFVETTFRPISEIKNLSFKIEIDENLPHKLDTDVQRLSQILKNLLSNAFKFTEKGEVKLSIHRPSLDQRNHVAGSFIIFSVEDTGIGIPEKTLSLIFEAFRQAEGSTSRKYGGTGLGLSISKGFAELLGGAILVESEPGKGSIFSLYLPLKYHEGNKPFKFSPAKQLNSPVTAPGITFKDLDEVVIGDDRSEINSIDKVVLVIEDDLRFARIMMDKAHDVGLKVVVAISYLEIFKCIQNFKIIAITLDVIMPESNGWNILKLLKSNTKVRHIPVHVISGVDYKEMAYEMGAKSFHVKPLSGVFLENLFEQMIAFNNRKLKKVLLINGRENERENLTKLLNNEFISTSYVSSAREALAELKVREFDSVITDFMLPGLKDLMKFLNAERSEIPVIVFTDKELDKDDLTILKGRHICILEKSEEFYGKLLNEVLNRMHVNTNTLDDEKIHLIENAMGTEDILDGKKVLIVDDDVRNLFTLTAAFERSKLEVLTADSGKEALEILEKKPGIDLVLMDIMMPDMDGYEAIQWIRKKKKNKYLPIIAVTAKAMVGDRKKCIASGASDYITKPVKTDQLLSLMRVWLYKQEIV
jgi:signal transduction histidine kinase/CheY-like chemotaxis protein